MTKTNGALSVSVKERIRFTTDLHAANAVLHTVSDSSFRIVKNLPKKYSENVLASAFGKYINFNK